MATTPQENRVSCEAASDSEYLSGQLFAVLSEQISLAKRGKVDEVLTLVGKIDELLCRADRKQLEKIWAKGSIRGLYDELCLILRAARGEVAGELAGVRKGRKSLRAYKDASQWQ